MTRFVLVDHDKLVNADEISEIRELGERGAVIFFKKGSTPLHSGRSFAALEEQLASNFLSAPAGLTVVRAWDVAGTVRYCKLEVLALFCQPWLEDYGPDLVTVEGRLAYGDKWWGLICPDGKVSNGDRLFDSIDEFVADLSAGLAKEAS